jgi:hypothetical protein
MSGRRHLDRCKRSITLPGQSGPVICADVDSFLDEFSFHLIPCEPQARLQARDEWRKSRQSTQMTVGQVSFYERKGIKTQSEIADGAVSSFMANQTTFGKWP